MKNFIKIATVLLFIGGLQGCTSMTSYSNGHYVKSHSNPYGYYENYGNCCKYTDYYFYSNYSRPYFYRETTLPPVDACTYQPSNRYFYFAPYGGHGCSYCKKCHHKHHYKHTHKHR